jgi:DNA-binding transcriptional LysR family regulator
MYLMLNVNRMRILREVGSRGSIAAAAEALYMTPSAVSQHMTTLSSEAGVALLEKSGRTVRLTPAGKLLVGHTERVLEVLEEAQADLDEISHGVAGLLRTCTFPSAARALMMPALSTMREEHPQLEITMIDLEPEESLPLLKTGEIDIILAYEFDHLPEPKDPGVERHLLLTEPVFMAVPADHPLALGPVRVADFAEDNWIVGRTHSQLIEVVLSVTHEAGFEPRTDLQSNDIQVILAGVQAGLGVALIPPIAVIADFPGVTFHSPTDVKVIRRIEAVIRRGSHNSPPIAAALKALHEAARDFMTRGGIMRTF